MINFQIDYAEGAYPTIMSALMQTNMLQTPGMGQTIIVNKQKNTFKHISIQQSAIFTF